MDDAACPTRLRGPVPAEEASSLGRYGRGASLLTVLLGVTGLVTYAYFGLSSHLLSETEYGGITLLWSAVFIAAAVLHRPVEQFISRSATEAPGPAAARGVIRTGALIHSVMAALFLLAALMLRQPLETILFRDSPELYWIFLVTVLAYAPSYFLRGLLAGRQRYGIYGTVVFVESCARLGPLVLVSLGLLRGQLAVAGALFLAPVVSLIVAPLAFRRIRSMSAGPMAVDAVVEKPAIAKGGKFTAAVAVAMAAEQLILNAGPVVLGSSSAGGSTALAGFAFNVVLVARVPLQLFQGVQAALLPHLTGLRIGQDSRSFQDAVKATLGFIALADLILVAVMAAAGPSLMNLLFSGDFVYMAPGLALIAIAMGLYLAASTLAQALLASGAARTVAVAWVASAGLFLTILWTLRAVEPVLRLELAFFVVAVALLAVLAPSYRRLRD